MHKRGVGPLPYWPTLLASYLADVLTLPLELTLLRWIMRRFYFRTPVFVLPLSWVVATWLTISIWFEGILPYFSRTATGDPFDVAAYAVGGLLFWRWLNQPA
ncbi:hypothetical protein [Hymenobacter volaticus]|uniref:Magnesium citrate secondary transporter n=1 Tax=Hymenobacter volaticus TaxID=2932254 RepID=A0ABY4G129_9BACT|nr:hypothetical protein [Hymenobacter volaticus]UOQ64536.1 hypothetical protein MUN86_13170 [Hymenobacter volaticus]